jgi:pimeloyl-ACP methyl ester carboxylesterase
MAARVPYDEFSMFADNAAEYDIPYPGPPTVRRESVEVGGGRRMSTLVWASRSGDTDPQLVFLHGGAQNAHTWDTVALALDVACICIDLPGHGHSDSAAPYAEGAGPLAQNADDMAMVIRRLAPNARAVVGMSLGGLTSLALSHRYPDIVRRLVLVDITPGVNQEKTKQITDFVNGPATFPSFEELLERTIQFNPTRTESSLRRGILHNALQLDDGSWVWRYRRDDAPPLPEMKEQVSERPSMNPLWDAVSAWGGSGKPLMFVRGMRPQSVVGDDDEAELLRRVPGTRVEHVQEAGHSVQGDQPVLLAELIRDFAL